jgi:hypothetical protein
MGLVFGISLCMGRGVSELFVQVFECHELLPRLWPSELFASMTTSLP